MLMFENMNMNGFDLNVLQKTLVVLFVITIMSKIIKHMWSFIAIEKEPIRVLVVGAAGEIGYAIVPMIAKGVMLGPHQPVILHLFDKELAAEDLKGLEMELIDSALPLLKGVIASTDVVEACMGVNIAIVLGGFQQNEEGMDKEHVLSKNISIYKDQASALEKHAAPDCKVLLVVNPASTIAHVLRRCAPSIPKKNITCLARLDHNIALGQIAEALEVQVSEVKNVIIWGAHSSKPHLDINHSTVNTNNTEELVTKLLDDDPRYTSELVTNVQQRAQLRKQSNAMSIASAACDHIHDWVLGTSKGTWVSMGVCSDGSYGIQPGIFYSFPVTCENGRWSIVQGLKIDELSRAKIDASCKKLMEEK